jgi:hypothetical protein
VAEVLVLVVELELLAVVLALLLDIVLVMVVALVAVAVLLALILKGEVLLLYTPLAVAVAGFSLGLGVLADNLVLLAALAMLEEVVEVQMLLAELALIPLVVAVEDGELLAEVAVALVEKLSTLTANQSLGFQETPLVFMGLCLNLQEI